MELVVKTFEELTRDELYEILKVRSAVFVVEQNCPYQDIDGVDRQALHVFLRQNDRILSYLRVFDRDKQTAQIGRVLTVERGKGFGKTVFRAGLQAAEVRMKKKAVYLEAQTYAIGFYEKEGFRVTSEEFLEDGIPHVKMEYTFPPERQPEWYVYMLRCGDDTLYTGITDNVERRFAAHCAGKGAKYTRGRGPLKLVYTEKQPNKSSALKRELAVKKLTRPQKEKLCAAWTEKK